MQGFRLRFHVSFPECMYLKLPGRRDTKEDMWETKWTYYVS